MTTGSAKMSITFIIIALQLFSFVGDSLAENPHFVVEPRIVSKNLSVNAGTLSVRLTLNFIADGLGNKPLTVYLSTTGGTSNNTVCINSGVDGNLPENPKVIDFSPTKGKAVTIQPENNRITFNNMHLFLTIPVSQSDYCPDGRPPFIRTATLQKVELHLVQDIQNSSSEVLNFNFGDIKLQTAYKESIPHS
jgi:hypothetical protein